MRLCPLSGGCVGMTQSKEMRVFRWLALLPMVFPALPQTQEDSFRVYTEHPRLFLRPQRLRLLTRERQRQSMRWQQFETLVAGKAPMPEPGFAYALYYRISGDQAAGRQAIQWAMAGATDLRQLALVFDWCQDLLTPAQSKNLAGRLQRGIDALQNEAGVAAVRSRALAAVALAGHLPQASTKELERLGRDWWEGRVVPDIKAGKDVLPRDDLYPLMEFLHAIRDNLNLELRDSLRAFFKALPIEHLLSHYPATYPAPEGDFRITAARSAREPNLRHACLARAAELSVVAYDSNAPESQVLQGWLMHDRFLMRGTFGIPYEFLWANPYQPGLSYYHVPLVYHNEHFGRLFVRSSWDESATWLGYFDGELQLFQDGKVTVLNPQLTSGPISLAQAVVYFGNNARRFKAMLKEDEEVFILGLKPRQRYDLEVDGEEIHEERTDAGGILELKLPHKVEVGVRLKESP